MKVYAVMELVSAGKRSGKFLSFQELTNVWESPSSAIRYIKNNPNLAGYYINVFDTENGQLIGLAEYRRVNGKMKRVKKAIPGIDN